MNYRPILFSPAMVRALLEGRKTQTRRVLKKSTEFKGPYNPDYLETHRDSDGWAKICPYGQVGDRLWVRESWHVEGKSTIGDNPESIVLIAYKPCSPRSIAGGWSQDSGQFNRPTSEIVCPTTPTFKKDGGIRWFPSIHMPRWASRISLEINGIRIEQLQLISSADALAEGFDSREDFAMFFKADVWNANPWMWVMEFKVMQDA